MPSVGKKKMGKKRPRGFRNAKLCFAFRKGEMPYVKKMGKEDSVAVFFLRFSF